MHSLLLPLPWINVSNFIAVYPSSSSGVSQNTHTQINQSRAETQSHSWVFSSLSIYIRIETSVSLNFLQLGFYSEGWRECFIEEEKTKEKNCLQRDVGLMCCLLEARCLCFLYFFFLCVYSRECSAAALQGARRTPSVFVEETRWLAGRPAWLASRVFQAGWCRSPPLRSPLCPAPPFSLWPLTPWSYALTAKTTG